MKINKLITAISIFCFTIVSAQEKLTNFEEAKEIALEGEKNIVLIFSGSDWCLPCVKLEKNIFSTEEFKTQTNQNWVLMNADFPQKKGNKKLQSEALKTQNKILAEKYNKEGYFPLIVLLDKELSVIGTLDYEKATPTEFAQKINAFIE